MELAIFFYAAGVIESVENILGLLSVISIVLYLVVFGIGYMNIDCSYGNDKVSDKDKLKCNMKSLKWIPILSVSALVFTAFIPSKDTMYTMAAAYGVQTAVENPNVQRVAGKSLQLLEGRLDEYLKSDKKGE